MTKEEMFHYMVETIKKEKGWELGYKELWLMEKCFLMGIKYEQRRNEDVNYIKEILNEEEEDQKEEFIKSHLEAFMRLGFTYIEDDLDVDIFKNYLIENKIDYELKYEHQFDHAKFIRKK
jgi:hypothetical protein